MVNFSDKLEQACKAADAVLGGCPVGSYFDSFDSSDRMGLIMDLLAADGENGNQPLDWGALLADRTTLFHDVSGIHRHMDRGTGQLTGCFMPRAARKAETGE